MKRLDTYPTKTNTDAVLTDALAFAANQKHWFFLAADGALMRAPRNYPIEFLATSHRFDESWDIAYTKLDMLKRGDALPPAPTPIVPTRPLPVGGPRPVGPGHPAPTPPLPTIDAHHHGGLDLDASRQWLFISETGLTETRIRILSVDSLREVGRLVLPGRYRWCAYNPYDGCLYTCAEGFDQALRRFEVKAGGGSVTLERTGLVRLRRDGDILGLRHIISGAFSSHSATLYLLSAERGQQGWELIACDARHHELVGRIGMSNRYASSLAVCDVDPLGREMKGEIHLLCKLDPGERSSSTIENLTSERERGTRIMFDGTPYRGFLAHYGGKDIDPASLPPHLRSGQTVRRRVPGLLDFRRPAVGPLRFLPVTPAVRPTRRADLGPSFRLPPPEPPPELRSIVILVHGVLNDERGTHKKFINNCRSYWPELEKSQFVRMYWGDVGFEAGSYQVGKRTWQASGMSDRAWSGAAKLKELVGRFRRLVPKIPITVVSHSQGSVLTLSALQDGLKVDNWVLMGSPLGQGTICNASGNSRMARAADNVRGSVVNFWSSGDWVAVWKNGIGEGGLVLRDGQIHIKEYPIRSEHRNIIDVEVRSQRDDDVDHGEWWGREWYRPRQVDLLWLSRPVEFEPPALGSLLLGINLDDPVRAARPIPPLTYSKLELVMDWSEADTTYNWSGDSDYERMSANLHLLPGLRTSFHFDDADKGSIRIYVEEASVSVRLSYAIDHEWNRHLGWIHLSQGEELVESLSTPPGLWYRVRKDATFRLAIENRSDANCRVTVVFASQDQYGPMDPR